MGKYVLTFEQFTNSEYDETNEFFSFTRAVAPLQKEVDHFLDILDILPIELDNFYFKYETKAKKVQDLEELISLVNDALVDLDGNAVISDKLEAFKQALIDNE